MQLIDRIRLSIAVAAAKIITSIIRLLKMGAASVLPGTISSRIQPQILSLLCRQVKHGFILIVGTNGKTTTSLLLKTMLEKQGWKVAHNATGANLQNGLITALLDNTNLFGKLSADYGILEVDENILPPVLPQIKPKYILALNLFRDQLDRYGEVDIISRRWQEAIAKLSPETVVILNGDDPSLSYLGQNLAQKVLFFGLSEPEKYLEEIPHAVDSIYCPSCGHSLEYQGVYLSHQGDFKCPSCGFAKAKLNIDSRNWPQVLIGVYNKYNTLACVLTAQEIGIKTDTILDTINNFQAAFGRAEELEIEGKRVLILLSKNPVALNETIRAVVDRLPTNSDRHTTLMVLNDRTPDGTDVSWIWDVDTEKLVEKGGNIVVSGDRVYDMALRLRYSINNDRGCNLIVKENLNEAINTALEHTLPGQTLHILPTYSAMLEVRGILTGREIL